MTFNTLNIFEYLGKDLLTADGGHVIIVFQRSSGTIDILRKVLGMQPIDATYDYTIDLNVLDACNNLNTIDWDIVAYNGELS